MHAYLSTKNLVCKKISKTLVLCFGPGIIFGKWYHCKYHLHKAETRNLLSQTPLLLIWNHVMKSQPIRCSHVRPTFPNSFAANVESCNKVSTNQIQSCETMAGKRTNGPILWAERQLLKGCRNASWHPGFSMTVANLHSWAVSCGHLWGCPHRGVWSLIRSLWVLGLISVSVEDFVSYLSSSTPFLVFLIHLVLIQLFVTKNHSLKSNEFILCLKS
jgi:hypothetical protein